MREFYNLLEFENKKVKIKAHQWYKNQD